MSTLPTPPPGTAIGRASRAAVDFVWLESDSAEPDAPLALLLHGFPDSAMTWRHLIPRLSASGFRPVAPWMRGYWPTSVPTDGLYQIGALADDACWLHEELAGDERAVLIGHDWGAMATYSATGWQPERWAKSVAMSVPPAVSMLQAFTSYDQLRRSWYMFFFQNPLAEGAVLTEDLTFISRLWNDWSPGFDATSELGAVKDALRDPANLAAALGYYRAMLGSGQQDPGLQEAQAAWMMPGSVPTLYLHGRNDGCIGAEWGDDATAHLAPNSRSEIIDGVGHFLQLENPERVNEAIVKFLTEGS